MGEASQGSWGERRIWDLLWGWSQQDLRVWGQQKEKPVQMGRSSWVEVAPSPGLGGDGEAQLGEQGSQRLLLWPCGMRDAF